MKIFECPKCKSANVFTKKNGNQVGLYCGDCGKWIKWLTKEEVRLYELQLNEKIYDNTEKIQCASCGYLGEENEWYGITIHTKVKCCPKCGTLRYIHENNKKYRRGVSNG